MEIEIRLQRIYEKPNPADGIRILVDRLWPRGVSKQSAALNHWAKELAPSNQLRRWLHQDKPTRYREFSERYRQELNALSTEIQQLAQLLTSPTVTLLTTVKDIPKSHVPILADYLITRLNKTNPID